MPWGEYFGIRVWVGMHRLLGPVVFDPTDQSNVGAANVRLYVASENCLRVLPSQETRAAIEPAAEVEELFSAAKPYCASRARNHRQVSKDDSSASNAVPPISLQSTINFDSTTDSKSVEETTPIPARQCVDCRAVIHPERIRTVPNTIRCLRCQTVWEQTTGGEPPSVVDLGEVWFPRLEHWRNRGRKRYPS